MKNQVIFVLAGVVAGFGVATLIFVGMYGSEDDTSPPSEQKVESTSENPGSEDQTDPDEGQAEPSGESESPDNNSRASVPDGRDPSEPPSRGNEGSEDGKPGPNYIKTGEVTKEIDLSEQQQGEAQKQRGGAQPEMISLGESTDAVLGPPDEAPEGQNAQMNWHHFRAKKGQSVRISISANNDDGIRPFVILWSFGDNQKPDEQLEMARNSEGGDVEFTHTVEESGTFVLSVEDARNVPLRKSEPDQYYGGPNFGYSVTIEEAGSQ